MNKKEKCKSNATIADKAFKEMGLALMQRINDWII
jgi:hypothetical protein